MAGQIIDYIVATTIIGMLFLNVVPITQSAYYPAALYSGELNSEELNGGESASQDLILDPDSPAMTILSFFIDPDSSDSTSMYTLDPDKVALLNEENPFSYLSYEELLTQLDLQGYGFNITITLPFDVAIELLDSSDGDLEFLVTVLDEGMPLSGVVVEPIIVYTTRDGGIYLSTAGSSQTFLDGKTNLSVDIPPEAVDYVILFRFTVGGFSHFLVYEDPHPYLDVFHFDDITSIRLSQPPSQGAVWIQSLVGLAGTNLLALYDSSGGNEDKLTWGGDATWWNHTVSGLDDVSIVFVGFKEGSKRWVELGFSYMPLLNGDYGLTYGGEPPGSYEEVTLVVSIAGLIYELHLILWEEG